MLWHALHEHGAMVRDSGGSGNNVVFQTDQDVNDFDPLVLGMDQFGSEIMAQTQILTNQGPNSVNGGGTPIVPLNPSPGGSSSYSSQSSGSTGTSDTTTPADAGVITPTSGGSVTDGSGAVWTLTGTGDAVQNGTPVADGSHTTELTTVGGVLWGQAESGRWSSYGNGYWTAQPSAPPVGTATTASTDTAPISGTGASTSDTSGNGSTITVPASESSTTISATQATVNATSGDHMLFITGNANTFNLSGGNETVTDNGSGGNTFVLPAAGNGSVAFNAAVLNNGDVFDLTTALGATSWDGSADTLSSYLQVQQANGTTSLLVSNDGASGAGGTMVASFANTQVSLATILAHSTT